MAGSTSPTGGWCLLRRKPEEYTGTLFGIFREGPPLEEAVEKVRELKERAGKVRVQDKGMLYNTDLTAVLELLNLLLLAETIAGGALKRTESRGSHYRVDYPERNDEDWQRCITAKCTDGGMVLDTLVIDPEWEFRAGDMGDTHWG